MELAQVNAVVFAFMRSGIYWDHADIGITPMAPLFTLKDLGLWFCRQSLQGALMSGPVKPAQRASNRKSGIGEGSSNGRKAISL
jgi:hypothetical protein